MSKRWLTLLALSFAVMEFGMPSLNADDWPQWAGPKRDGIWRETGILEKFPADTMAELAGAHARFQEELRARF